MVSIKMRARKLLQKFTLDYQDPVERQEYTENKEPFLKEFFKYCSLVIIGFLIPYTARFFDKDASPQKYIVVGILGLAIAIFCVQTKLTKYMEYFILGYVLAMIALVPTVARGLLPKVSTSEAFYMGFGYALIHRLVGYQVVRFRYMVLILVVSCCVKYPLIPDPDIILNFMVIVLEIGTLILAYKSEKMERGLFDSFYKSKKDILKFKHLLTTYLPNQMVIFAKDCDHALYMNNSFKRTFKCPNPAQAKESLGKYIIEKDTLEKFKGFFTRINFLSPDANESYSLSRFMLCLAQNTEILKDLGVVSFPVLEDDRNITLNQEVQRENTNEEKNVMESEMNFMPKNSTRALNEDSSHKIYGGDMTARVGNNVPDGNNNSFSNSDGTNKSGLSGENVDENVKRSFKIKIFPIMWDDSEAIAIFLDDITKQRIIMELKTADQNKDLVIAMVSHDLRTPLNGMLGLLDIAKKQISQSSALRYLEACKNSGVLMLNLVNSVLDMNQIKNKKLKLVFTKVNIKELLNEIKSLFDYSCLLKNLYLNIEIDPKIPKNITTDKSRLGQILVNLLGNAFKFTFSGGVTVKIRPDRLDSKKVWFYIEDTGIGIKKQDQNRLFKMYGKLEQEDTKVNTHGIGLGLTMSNMLAILLNPKDQQPIQMESEIGKGTCFYFAVQSQKGENGSEDTSLEDISSEILAEDHNESVLRKMSLYATNESSIRKDMPQKSDEIDQKTTANSKPANSIVTLNNEDNQGLQGFRLGSAVRKSSENKRHLSDPLGNKTKLKQISEENAQEPDKPWCLIVDDNPFNLMVACHIMEERNYLVKTALNGQEGIERAQEHKSEGRAFRVILMDCQMPVMDGYEASKILTDMMKRGELDECPIIALTANNRDEIHDRRCEAARMSGHISKPLHVNDLESVLKRLYSGKKVK